MDQKQAQQAMLRKIADSGLTARDAERLYFQAYPSDHDLDLPIRAAGFKIPYWHNGKPNGFYRYRLLEAPPASNGFMAAAAKYPKYLQPAGSSAHVYFPEGVDWPAIFADPRMPLLITEGELKAICACARGVPTIGLGGVWSFKDKSHDLLPELAKVAWGDKKYTREVRIVYDSDALTNPQVVMAENALARQLLKRGGAPFITRIPPSGDAKVGLDDWLMVNDDQAFADLLESASEWGPSAPLHELNEEVVYVRDPGLIMRLENLQKMSPDAFKSHQYSNRTIMVQEPTLKSPNKMVEKSAPFEWLKWPSRSEVEAVTYVPGSDRFVDGRINTWPGWGCEPKKGNIGPWKKLLDYLFKGLPIERRYFEQWCACPLQNPGIKMYVAVVMWGIVNGTGKSLVGYTLKKIYGKNFDEIDDSHLTNRNFTEWAENKQFILGDEVTATEKRGLSTMIKNLITRHEVRINIKHIPSFTVPDCINYYFTSNLPDAFFMDDTDRRLFVNEVNGAPLPLEFYRKEYDPWLKSEEGPAALFHHLLNLDLSGFDPAAPALDTLAKADMRMIARSGLGGWVRELRDTPDNVLRIGDIVNGWYYATTNDLMDLYDPSGKTGTTLNAMSRELRNAGFTPLNEGKQVVLPNSKRVVLWEVRKHTKTVRKPQPKWLAAEYMKNFSR